MPPKKRKRNDNKRMELEKSWTTDYEEVDALTAEPLEPGKYIKVNSPDGSLCLYYNTSSLIKVAQSKGAFMHPPHFMEPMSDELIAEIEKIEGRSFTFSDELNPNIFSGADGVIHRHMNFDDIMEEFYRLNPADVYVCPYCYSHYLSTRYISSLEDSDKWLKYINDGVTLPLDPLDVLDHMRLNPIQTENECINPLIYIVFRHPRAWKKHIQNHHTGIDGSPGDYRLRDVLCSYYSAYNLENEERYKERLRDCLQAAVELPMTQQRYWFIQASYNKFRYNRIVEVTESAAASDSGITEQTAFPKEVFSNQYQNFHESDSDFIDDSDSNSVSYDGPRYSPLESFSVTGSFSSSTISDEESTVSCSSEECKDMNKAPEIVYDSSLRQWGNDSEYIDDRLTSENICFLQSAAKRVQASTSLYDPIIHHLEGLEDDKPLEDDHFEDFKPTQTMKRPRRTTSSNSSLSNFLNDTSLPASSAEPVSDKNHQSRPVRASKLLLDDDTESISQQMQRETISTLPLRAKLLLDDE